MTIPDDLDDAFELLQQKAQVLDAALDATEAEQAQGRSGHASYIKARQIAEELKELSRIVVNRIEEARGSL